jgi:SRSO17 transposase
VWTEEDRTVAAGHSVDPGRWLAGLDDLLGCVAARMCRVEPRLRLRRFVLGMMAGLPRTNCWSLAEHAGEACPRGMQRLLSSASWDADRVLRDVRDWVVSRLGEPGRILVIDETGDLKKGAATVGVQRQYTSTAGRIESSQVAVYLTYACGQSDKGHALMDRALYLPKSWTGDVQRMAAAGVPAEVGFATKPALAQAMISDALDAGVPASWVAADEVYGADSKLRRHLRQAGLGYVLAVAKNHQITTGIGPRAAIDLAARLPKRSWQRLSAGRGCKGERWHDWALVDTIDPPADPPADPRVDPAADPADPPAPPAGAGAGQHWLLIRRSRTTGVQRFDAVGGMYHPPQHRRERQKRDEAFPRVLKHSEGVRVLAAQLGGLERLQLDPRRLSVGGLVDRFRRGCDSFPVAPVDESHRGPDQMHHPGLDR